VSLAILCPGQGGQHAAMFDVIAGNPEAEAVVAMAGSVLPAAVRDVLNSGSIHQNRIAQPLVCAAILSRWRVLERELPRPALVLGTASVSSLRMPLPAAIRSQTACG